MPICNSCSNNYLKVKNIFEHVVYYNNVEIKWNDLVKVFNNEIIDLFAGYNGKFYMCLNCLELLEATYTFIQQIKRVQLKVKSCITPPRMQLEEDELVNNKKDHLKTKHSSGAQQIEAYLHKRYKSILPKSDPRFKVSNEKPGYNANSSTSCKRFYKCFECGKNFSGYKSLKHHLENHASNGRNGTKKIPLYICQQCHLAFSKQIELMDHEKLQHTDGKFKCHMCCEREYSSKGFLLRHCIKTHNQQNINYYCGHCKELMTSFKNYIELEEHFFSKHYSKEQHSPVDVAENIHLNEDEGDMDLEMHEEFLDEFLLAHTSDDNSFQFSECWEDLDLNLPDMLQMHQDQKNNCSLENFSCPECTEQFKQPQHLLQHLSSQHTHYYDSYQMPLHHTNNHSVPQNSVLCPYCNKRFSKVLQLKQHLRIVHARNKRHICQLCDKQFSTLDHLKKHVLSQHHNERKHICHVCAKRFTQSGHLRQHLGIHTTGKSLQCSHCSAKFWRKIDLKIHHKRKHNIEEK